MYCILQTLLDTRRNDIVLYLGIKGRKALIKDISGRIEKVSINRLKPIRDCSGKVVTGKEPEKWGTKYDFFGYVKEQYWEQVNPDMDLRQNLKTGDKNIVERRR